MWGHVNGSDPKPTSGPKPTDTKKDEKTMEKWKIKDAQIMSWILGFVKFQFILHLRPYNIANDMWNYLKHIYK